MKISIFSYPKINLTLDILRRDKSGYHEIQTIFHELKEPFDEIILENRKDGVLEVACDNPKVPLDGTNTVLKAAKLLKKYIGAQDVPRLGAKIFIKKRIPLMSGLGGGSSNAVAALKGLAKLWEVCHCEGDLATEAIHLTQHRLLRHARNDNYVRNDIHAPDCILRKIADQIGMDCQFFFNGGTALATHFGEKITPLPPLPPEIKFEIIETGVEISSRRAYSQINLARCGKNAGKTEKLIAAIRAGDTKNILKNLHNDFEEFIFEKYPQLREIKYKIESKSRKTRTILCGSGGALVKTTDMKAKKT